MSDSLASQQNRQHIIYLLSPDSKAAHINDLVKILSQNKIPIQFHKDNDSLGVTLDRRYFVVVDNMQGKIVLGPWFSSLLLFIVGYPKIGNNKKNHYCSKPQYVLEKYREFCSLPEFIKKNFLSSAISEKSFLKTSRSLNSKIASQTTGSKIDNKNIVNSQPLPKISQFSKLFLYLSKDPKYNKLILKIAANNQKKFQIVEDIENLELALSVCRTSDNFLMVNIDQYETIQNKNFKGLKIIVYAQQETKSINKQNVIGISKSRNQIIQIIRNIGFHVVSLKDIDKSIVKYDNPFAKQLKPRSNKRINWEKQTNSQEHIQIALKEKNKASTPNLEYNVNKVNIQTSTHPVLKGNTFEESSQESLKIQSVTRNMELEVGVSKQKKRMSIQSNVSKNQKKQKNQDQAKQIIKNIEYDIPLPINKQVLQEVPYTQPPRLVKKIKRVKSNHSKKSKQSNTQERQGSVSSSLSKQSKVLRYRSIEPEVFNSINSLKDTQMFSTIEKKFPLLHLATTDSWREINQQQNIGRNSSKKQNNIKYQLLQNKILSKFGQNLTDIENKENQNIFYQNQRSSLIGRNSIFQNKNTNINFPLRLACNNNLINRKNDNFQFKSEQKEKISYNDALLVWKDFNFQIQNNRNYILQSIQKNMLKNLSFYSPLELSKIVEECCLKHILIFIDQTQIQQYLLAIEGFMYIRKIMSIYVFQKTEKSQAEFVKNIRQLVKFKPFSNFKQIIKPVIFNEYFDEGLQAAKQLITFFS